jgi:hypothetical protein
MEVVTPTLAKALNIFPTGGRANLPVCFVSPQRIVVIQEITFWKRLTISRSLKIPSNNYECTHYYIDKKSSKAECVKR